MRRQAALRWHHGGTAFEPSVGCRTVRIDRPANFVETFAYDWLKPSAPVEERSARNLHPAIAEPASGYVAGHRFRVWFKSRQQAAETGFQT
jgi:hypothetical protein